MIVSEISVKSKVNKFTVLKRNRITRKFWRSAKSDEIIFISAPMLYGKTTAVINAMQELNKEYIYIRFDHCLNNLSCFCGYMLNRLEKFNEGETAVNKQDINALLASLGNAKRLDAVIFDDFQLCNEQAVIKVIKSIYKLYGEDIQIILLSRNTLPKEFSGWQYENKIITIDEEDLRFNFFEIKKFAEQNKVFINNAYTNCLSKKSSGCIGFIEEEIQTGRFYINKKLPDTVLAYINCAVSNCKFNKILSIFSELTVMSEIPKTLLTELYGEKAIEKILSFIRETGLIKEKDNAYILHNILKSYMENIKIKKCSYNIYNFLVSKRDYENALKYAVITENRENIENILQIHLSAEITIPEFTFEKIYRLYNNNPIQNETVNYFLLLFELKMGHTENIKLLLSAGERHPGIKANLKAHAFTSIYPHINAELGFIRDNDMDRLLIKCGKLYDDMKFFDALNILNQIKDSCEGEAKAVFFCLLIETLRSLYMYTAAENEIRTFSDWAEENTEFYGVFEDLRTEINILSGDNDTARELASVNNTSLNAKIYRSNIKKTITVMTALIAIGEIEAALYRLKNIVDFAEKAVMVDIQIESLVLLAIAYHEKKQTEQAVCYMEKAVYIAEINKKTALISRFGKDVRYLIEKCFLRARKKNICCKAIQKILLHTKNINMRGCLLPVKEDNAKLSERQRQMLVLLSENCTYNQIAESTGIKITTVRDHIKKLYEKLEVRNAADALVKAREKKII